MLTASEDKNEFVQAMKLGCSGIVLKQTAPDLIVKSIRKVNCGRNLARFAHHGGGHAAVLDRPEGSAVHRRAAEGPRAQSAQSRANARSSRLVAQGYKNKEMAEKMFISEQTVKNHLHNIFDKLGVSDRLELALYAIHKGLHINAER